MCSTLRNIHTGYSSTSEDFSYIKNKKEGSAWTLHLVVTNHPKLTFPANSHFRGPNVCHSCPDLSGACVGCVNSEWPAALPVTPGITVISVDWSDWSDSSPRGRNAAAHGEGGHAAVGAVFLSFYPAGKYMQSRSGFFLTLPIIRCIMHRVIGILSGKEILWG